MKKVIFCRGIPSEDKVFIVEKLLDIINPDINNIRGMKLSLNDFGDNLAASAKSFKNMVRRLIISHSEEFIIIDNESSLPSHWQSIQNYITELRQEIEYIGININNIDKTDKKYNKHDKSDQFKLEMHKYYEVNINNIEGFLIEFKNTYFGE